MQVPEREGVGLEPKFIVERIKPSSRGIDHSSCRYFVLDPQHDPLAAEALAYYARLAEAHGDLALAEDLDDWLIESAI
jgi:hypothetical protein